MTLYCDNPEEHDCGRRSAKNQLDDRLRTAWATAMRQRNYGRVEIHLGSNVIEHLRSLAERPDSTALGRTIWGFPVVEMPAAFPNHISVHTVEVIP